MIQLVAFFGNPGLKYAGNRHNAAWHLIASLPFSSSLSWQKKFQGLYTTVERKQISAALEALSPQEEHIIFAQKPLCSSVSSVVSNSSEIAHLEKIDLPEKIHFIKPETYMNCSGEPVFQLASFFKIKPEKILVIHDELEIPLGFISLKFSGGLGGHNGLRSMKACFNTADFWRLRIGIGRPNHDDISSWVLSDFTNEETDKLYPTLDIGAALLLKSLSSKPDKLLPEWAKKKVAE